MKFCMTKTKNEKNIKRQNEKNLISEQNVVIVEKKCDSCLNNYLNEKKKEKEKKWKEQCEKSIKRAFAD